MSWRGLWDRFAEPRTPEAYQRSLAKGVPCLIDARAAGTTPSMLLLAVLGAAGRVPVYVAIDRAEEMREPVARVGDAWPLRFIDRSGDPPYPVVAPRSGSFERIGSYYSFPGLPEAVAHPAGRRRLVLFESADVLQSANERSRHAHRLQEETSRRFAETTRTWGDDVQIVSDLVEHRQLLSAQGRA